MIITARFQRSGSSYAYVNGEILQVVPDALDAVSSPNKDLLGVLTDNKLLVFIILLRLKATTTIDIEENQK